MTLCLQNRRQHAHDDDDDDTLLAKPELVLYAVDIVTIIVITSTRQHCPWTLLCLIVPPAFSCGVLLLC